MRQPIEANHFQDIEENPAGGRTTGTGIQITWQNGPLGRHGDDCTPETKPGEMDSRCHPPCDRRAPNGAFVEGVIAAAKDRLEFYQRGKFACDENAAAIEHLDAALEALSSRTASREKAGVEGTHAVVGGKAAKPGKKKAAK
jgi:hypothetical protein